MAGNQTYTWAKNMAGMRLTDEETEAIPYPGTELLVHITTKTVQAGAVLGVCLVNPIFRMLKRTDPEVGRKAGRIGVWGMGIGLLAGPAMTYMRAQSAKIEHDGFYDRSYRLRRNECQVNVDRFTYLFGLIGLGIGGLPMAAYGVTAGTIGAGVYNNFIRPKPEKVKKEEEQEPKKEQ